ncbi:hypothetical protein EIP91_010431 [Steccherinum ochraceum]|uniref:UBA domain-containing protein n=1 Tax=Steccherinum ochraceum TaxID=92696 RepID=A0A4R0R8I9_9APHY|nr:hypothetical protein EIP91_010431 [Steccherinum ochraceum]
MSDSFADLWNSTTPVKPAEPPKKLGALSASSSASNGRKPTNDVFSLLATTSSSSSSRSITPSYTNTPQSASSSRPNVTQKTSSSSSGDAFSGLLSGSLAPGSANQANMTIAQRAAQAERQRSEELLRQHNATQKAASAWAGLDSLGKPSSSATKGAPSGSTNDDWAFDFASPPSQTQVKPQLPAAQKSSTAAVDDDDWGLGDFSAAPTKTQSAPARASPAPQKASTGSLWELDEFTSTTSKNGRQFSPEPPRHRSDTPGSFDFGDREDREEGLLSHRSDDEDDILGDLSKPVDQVRKAVSHTPSPQPTASGQRSRAVSPPPHIIGQIVEMGFSPQQARVALASTETGLDVQAALETLLANGAAAGEPSTSRPSTRSRTIPDERRRRPTAEDYEDDVAPRRRQTGAKSSPPVRDTPSPEGGEGQTNFQEHADKIIAQASEIGLSMFSRANALWKQGREKMQQAYEEQKGARAGSGSSSGPKGSQPRWMQEALQQPEGHDDGWGDGGSAAGFRDGEDEEPVLPPRPKERPKPQAAAAAIREPEPSRPRTGDLLSADGPTAYVSPWRRKATPRNEILTKSSRATTPVPAAPSPARSRSPAPLVQRQTVSASSSALAASAKHKEAGTEMFKLGRYAEAETSYSHAISTLPDLHLLLVPLYNNRALSRIKTGDHSGAIEDCTTVITLIGASYHPAREAKVTREDEGASVDLADGLIKAYRRRAEAYEGKEKWDAAMRDWEVIAGADFAGKTRGDAALNRVREANQAADAEDQMRHELKDTVDAKLVAWKNGKESNIRALIASLDTVLWPELGWQKVGMHELISPNQVKIRYTKAIAKLHPDKLNANNTTLEQRMIANGVFGSLNEAWNSFKP